MSPLIKFQLLFSQQKKEFDDEYKKIFKNEPKNWCIGCADRNNIRYVSLNDFENTSHKFSDYKSKEALNYYKKTLVHEYVHFVQKMFLDKNNINHCNAKYLTEGSAVYLSKQREGIRIVFDKTLEETLKGPSYDIWGALFKYLDNNYDKNFVLNLFFNDNYAISFLKNELFEKAKNNYLNK